MDSKNKVVIVVKYIVKKARVYKNSVLTKVDINVVIKLRVMLWGFKLWLSINKQENWIVFWTRLFRRGGLVRMYNTRPYCVLPDFEANLSSKFWEKVHCLCYIAKGKPRRRRKLTDWKSKQTPNFITLLVANSHRSR